MPDPLALAALTPLTLSVGDATLVRLDAVALVLVVVAGIVGATVLRYARTNLDGDPHRGRFFAAAAGLLASTLLLAVAASLPVAALAWVGASAATVALCRYRRDGAGQASARRARGPLLVGDLAVVAAAVLTVAAVGPVAFGDLSDELAGRTALGLSLTSVVAVLLVVAALARAGQAPFGPWMVGTVDAPTPVSALLHAGSVNAGGFLLVRSSDVLWASPVVRVGLAAAAIASIVLAAAEVRSRSDVKGRLATSTAGQMGVMLLAAAVGAPGAVLTHLAGHSLYKSSRFLGAGGAVGLAVVRRQGACGAPVRTRGRRIAVVTALTGAVALVGLAIGAGADVAPTDVGVAGALLVAVVACGGWAATATSGTRARATLLTTLGGATLLVVGAVLADTHLGLPHPDGGAGTGVAAFAAVALALVAASVGATRAPVQELAARWAAPPLPTRTRGRPTADLPVVTSAPSLGRSW